jgi:hypothetical protein
VLPYYVHGDLPPTKINKSPQDVWCFPTMCTGTLQAPTTTNGACCPSCPEMTAPVEGVMTPAEAAAAAAGPVDANAAEVGKYE